METDFLQGLAGHDLTTLSDTPFRLNGKDAIYVGLTVTLYVKAPYDSGFDERLCQCVDDYLTLAPKPKLAGPPTASQWVNLSKREFSPPWEVVSKLNKQRGWDYMFAWTADDTEASPWNVSVLRSAEAETWGLSYFHVTFPLNWAKNPKLLEVVTRWSERLDVYHGYVGISLLLPPDEIKQAELDMIVFAAARQFPGLNVDYPVSQSGCLVEGIKTVDWLTLIGKPLVEKLGGAEAIRKQLTSKFKVTSLKGDGLFIQAGPSPQLGDTTKMGRPELYVELNQILKPVRITVYPQAFQSGQFGEPYMNRAISNAWIARLD